MTETERKALALVNEMARELGWDQAKEIYAEGYTRNEALFRAIERHEAFRQEVSDELIKQGFINASTGIGRFIIIAKPDPLVEALAEAAADPGQFLAAIEKRGGKIVWGEG